MLPRGSWQSSVLPRETRVLSRQGGGISRPSSTPQPSGHPREGAATPCDPGGNVQGDWAALRRARSTEAAVHRGGGSQQGGQQTG